MITVADPWCTPEKCQLAKNVSVDEAKLVVDFAHRANHLLSVVLGAGLLLIRGTGSLIPIGLLIWLLVVSTTVVATLVVTVATGTVVGHGLYLSERENFEGDG